MANEHWQEAVYRLWLDSGDSRALVRGKFHGEPYRAYRKKYRGRVTPEYPNHRKDPLPGDAVRPGPAQLPAERRPSHGNGEGQRYQDVRIGPPRSSRKSK